MKRKKKNTGSRQEPTQKKASAAVAAAAVRPWLKREYMAMALITALVFVVFGWNITFDYIRADLPEIIFDNPHVLTGLSLENVVWAFTNPVMALYEPLVMVTFMLDNDLFGVWPGGYHIMTTAWHAACMCLFFYVMLTLTGNFPAVLAATLLISVHPSQIVSVSQIGTRNEVMQAFFLLLAILAYHRYATTGSRKAYGASLGFMLLGLFCKQTVVMLPTILLLLDYWPLRRVELLIRKPVETLRAVTWLIIEKAPFFALSLVGAAMAFWGKSQYGHLQQAATYMTIPQTAYHVITGYVRYLGHVVLPYRISYFFLLNDEPRPPAFFIFSGVLLVVLTVVALALLWKRPYVAVGWFWFLLLIFPVSGIVRYILETITLRYLYMPIMGLMLVFCLVLHEISLFRRAKDGEDDPAPPRWYWAVVGVLVVILSSLTFLQHGHFRDTESVSKRMLSLTDNRCPMGNTLLALLRSSQGLPNQASDYFQQAIANSPGNMLIHLLYAQEMMAHEQFKDAVKITEEALKLYPDDAALLGVCGLAQMSLHRFGTAEEYLRKALEKDPENPQYMHNLAYTLSLRGKYSEARAMFEQVLKIRPNDERVHILLQELDQMDAGSSLMRVP